MVEFIVSEPERTEDGLFLIKLLAEDGTTLAEGQGETQEEAIEDAKSKL
jgi:hypothetical protein